MGWQETSDIFNERAAEYDQWFDCSLLFDIEQAAVKSMTVADKQPSIEIGIGPGRFAQALDIQIGMDPAFAALKFSRSRNIACMQGIAETLPIKSNSFKTVYLLLSFCFLENRRQALKEIFRILHTDGVLVIGMIPAESAWGRHLLTKKNEGNPFYQQANFYTIAAVEHMLNENSFTVESGCTTLYQPPGKVIKQETPRSTLDENGGFAVLAARKKPNGY